MRTIDEIILHCTATNYDATIDEIREWHEARGFSDVGYHYLIRQSGIVEVGRPLWQIGAHAKGRNKNSIGIALNGHTTFHEVQFNSAARLCFDLRMQFGKIEINPHNKYSIKRCPVFNINIVKGMTYELERICSTYME